MFDKDFLVCYLRVVSGCNLNCTHCFTLGNQDKIKETQDKDIIDFLTSIKTRINPRKITLYLHGGETFLVSIDRLKEIVNLSKSILNDTITHVIPQTNLVYKLTQEHIDFIRYYCDNEVGVSWDYEIRFGSIRTDKAIEKEQLFFKNLKTLLENQINVHIAITAQRHLLKANPIKVVEQFHGVKSIDFELLTSFDEKTIDLKPNNKEWSDWYTQIVQYYHLNDTTWVLPQVDLLFKYLHSGQQQDCKCNCCSKRTFTLNPNGTVGLCPDYTYIQPFSTTEEMSNDWDTFQYKAQQKLIQDLVAKSSSLCYECEHYDLCGGNCNTDLFDETDECPLSRQALNYILANKDDFEAKYLKAYQNLPELRKNT